MATDTTDTEFVPALEAPHLPTPDVCPNCGFEGSVHREIKAYLLQANGNVAIVAAPVDICDHCGEQIYDLRTAGELQAIQQRLRQGEVEGMTPIGTVYRAPAIE